MVAILFFLFFILCSPALAAEPDIKITGYSASGSEYVELTNNTDQEINLAGWVIKDDNDIDDDIHLTSADTIPAKSPKKFVNTKDSTWLNDKGNTIYLYNNQNQLVDSLKYPQSTPISTQTPTPNLTPTTVSPSPSPTSTNLIINPSTGISMTEFMPYSSIKWVEIYNHNDFPVKLVGWKLKDNSSTVKNLPEISLPSKNFFTYDFSNYLNNDGDTVSLINHNNQVVTERTYSNDDYNLDKSWSLVNNSWCRADVTKGSQNAQSCYQKPTPTPKPTSSEPTSAPTKKPEELNLYTSTQDDIPTPINEPLTENPYSSPPSPTPSPLPQPTGVVLGDTSEPQTKRNYLPLLFIISGGGLLTSPLLINKFKKS